MSKTFNLEVQDSYRYEIIMVPCSIYNVPSLCMSNQLNKAWYEHSVTAFLKFTDSFNSVVHVALQKSLTVRESLPSLSNCPFNQGRNVPVQKYLGLRIFFCENIVNFSFV